MNKIAANISGAVTSAQCKQENQTEKFASCSKKLIKLDLLLFSQPFPTHCVTGGVHPVRHKHIHTYSIENLEFKVDLVLVSFDYSLNNLAIYQLVD